MEIDRIGVVGSGTMGSGIAQTAAQNGLEVVLYDISDEIIQKGVETIHGYWDRMVEKERMSPSQREEAAGRLHPATSLEAMGEVDVVVEAAPEDLGLKKRLFRDLDLLTPGRALLATNTSSLSVTVLSAATGRPGQVAGMHFFNPAPLMPLVEVIRGEETLPATTEALRGLAERMGKTPVTAKDVPGFIVNRVARNYYGEALKILGENGATTGDIDAVLEKAGFRMGPFLLMDLIGIDVNFAVTQSVYEANFGEPRFRPHPIQQRMVQQERLGRKAGKGFYRYEYGEAVDRPEPQKVMEELADLADGGVEAAARFLRGHAGAPEAADRVLPRVLGMVMNEAVFTLGYGIADREDIDTAMRLGTNWPEGPLAWAEQVGLEPLLLLMDGLYEAFRQERYRAAPLLRRLVREGEERFPDRV